MPIPKLTRRRFFIAAGSLATGVGLYIWRVEPHWVEVVERVLPIANLPAALAGKTLVQLSDLHVGPNVDTEFLIASLKKVSAMKSDFTVITGDLMTCRGPEQIEAVAKVLSHLEPGSLGGYVILGNHDYSVNWKQISIANRLADQLSELNLVPLRNEVRNVAGLQLVGLDDFWSPCFKPEAVLPQVDWSGPTLTLCHNPDAVDSPRLAAVNGWVLSGHTHGGQCKPPFLPPPILPVKNRRYTAGEFELGNGRWLYINRGLGHSARVRFNVRPEITRFRLEKQA